MGIAVSFLFAPAKAVEGSIFLVVHLNIGQRSSRLKRYRRNVIAPGSRSAEKPSAPKNGHFFQPWAIGYLAKISSARLKAFSAATCGAIPPVMMSDQAVGQTCTFCSWA